jgi:DNA (cytosine-5)-methyltransferase 1
MADRKPPVVLLENVPSFATSHGGQDLAAALGELNRLGYCVDVLMMDASWFVPQSRPRLFVIASHQLEDIPPIDLMTPSRLRPDWLTRFISRHADLVWRDSLVPAPTPESNTLDMVVEKLHADDDRWWNSERTSRFSESLSPIQAERLETMQRKRSTCWATAYRRTRQGKAVWEIRPDFISGCLRTARGGSSRQALVEASRGQWRVRWMTPREYARLQGAGNYVLAGSSENQALFGLGDAVCVPAVAWIARHSLRPLAESAGPLSRSHPVALAA